MNSPLTGIYTLATHAEASKTDDDIQPPTKCADPFVSDYRRVSRRKLSPPPPPH